MRREFARDYKSELDKLRKAFKKLRGDGIYAQAKAIGVDNADCQAMIHQAMDENPELRGGIYWNAQNEEMLDDLPILHLGYLPRTVEPRDEMLKNALLVAQETDQALNQVGLLTIWNGCICNTISVVLLPREEVIDGAGEEDFTKALKNRPCRCEEVWEMQFKNFAEEKLGSIRGKEHQNENDSEESDWS